jgi:hypothetical protein
MDLAHRHRPAGSGCDGSAWACCCRSVWSALSGCAPGFGGSGRWASPAPRATARPPPAPDKVIPITPDLIRSQMAQKPTSVPEREAPVHHRAGLHHRAGRRGRHHRVRPPRAAAQRRRGDRAAVDPTGVTVAPGFIVGANGEISFPYIGRTKVQGLTESGASELIARAHPEVHQGPAGHGAHPVVPQPARLRAGRGAHARAADLHRRADDAVGGHQPRRQLHHRRRPRTRHAHARRRLHRGRPARAAGHGRRRQQHSAAQRRRGERGHPRRQPGLRDGRSARHRRRCRCA